MKFYNAYINQYLKLFNKAGENMLSLTKLSAIRKIMEEMPDEVIEDCYAEAEQLAEKSIERFRDPLRKHWPDAYTEQACEYMEDSDVDYQEAESQRVFPYSTG
ncbi:hypothetical protein [Symbiopectobacterium purcellii]|uniref:hypothetical protein n=1 Tax=Symbiopectobacterium purcellii TaxID=2871826 RepID=UPI003F857EC8